MANQYQKQEYIQHDYEDDEYEETIQYPSFDWKKYIKTVSIVGVVLGLCGSGISYVKENYFYTTKNTVSIEDINTGDGIIDSTLTNEFTINGDYYSFPCTVQSFLDNGWSFDIYSDSKATDKVKGDDEAYINLENEKGQRLFLGVSSPTGEKINVQDGYIVYLSGNSSYDEEDLDMSLSGGIYKGMTCSELDSLLEENDWKYFKNTTHDNWYYSIELSEKDQPYEISYTISTTQVDSNRYVDAITINAYENYEYIN